MTEVGVVVTLLCKYKKKKKIGSSIQLRQKAINYFFQVYDKFTVRTEEAWGTAPVTVEDAAVAAAVAEPVPGGRGMGDDSHHSAQQPYQHQTAGPGSCSGLRMTQSGYY